MSSARKTGDSPGNSRTSRASSRITPAGACAGVEREAHLAPLGDGLERGQLRRDHLRLARLLVVDPPLDDEDAVGDAELTRGLEVELKTTTSTEPVGSSSGRKTIGSPRFVGVCLTSETIPPTVTISPSRRRSSSPSVASVLRRS